MRTNGLLLLLAAFLAIPGWAHADAGPLPDEPVEIGTGPQFLLDGWLVDNYWALRYKREAVRRVFHQPRKYEGNPLIVGDGGYVSVARDDKTGKWQMWYQTAVIGAGKGERAQYAIAYAESEDGIHWVRPELGLYRWKGTKENNICWTGIKGRRASSPFLLDVPEKDRKGYRHVMLYRETDGMHLIGSRDGIAWDRASDVRISPIHSDTQNALVHDPRRGEYVMYCRAKHLYRTFRGKILDTGESRRVARMASKELWTEWKAEPQNILIPDERDAAEGFDCFYGMPVRIHGGVYWGFLWPFKTNTDIHTELAFSRDGVRFERLPGRPKLIERGPEGSWDDGMVFGGYQWVEVGDEWWLYYAGWDGPHQSRTRKAGIGLVKVRKEGLVSVHGPAGGGVIVTRQVRWPGGELLVNADASKGELKVRVTDGRRKVLPGFDYDDCVPFRGDGVAKEVTWKEKKIGSLAGRVVRLEFFLKNADLYTFRATGGGSP
jgi:hypothetical protein